MKLKQKEVELYFQFVHSAAALSTAVRAKVGALVLDRNNNMVAFGYNGTMRGADNTCEEFTPQGLVTKDSTIHAEQNLICHAARRGISIEGGTVFVTHSPCIKCATLLYQAGIMTVYYDIEYRCHDEVMADMIGRLIFHKR